MYHHFFGLEEQAFSIAVNPRYLYMSEQHREALAHLLYGVHSGGFVQLTGEVGTGKTTLVRRLLEQLPEGTDVAMILNPRSEEHTSELQSRGHLVCRLLLEKKKTTHNTPQPTR